MTSTEIDGLRRQWSESERKLYPLATVSTEKYQALVRIAREAANDLSVVETIDGLVAHWPQAETIVRAASARRDLPLGDLPEQDVAGVAFALRDAELRAEAHQRQIGETIRSAVDRGEQWAMLHETGTLKHGLLDPYSAIELHVPSGAAIVSSVEPNPTDGSANHVLSVIRLDPTTGDTVDLEPGIAEAEEHATADRFEAARAALRTTVAAHR